MTNRTSAVLDATLKRMAEKNLIAPGAREEIFAKMTARPLGSPAKAIKDLFDSLTAIGGVRFHGPAWKKAVKLETVLEALPIGEHARKDLAARLALDANSEADVEAAFIDARSMARREGLPFDEDATEDSLKRAVAGKLATLVLKALDGREMRDAWHSEVRPPIPASEKLAYDAIIEHRHLLDRGVDVERLAIEWADAFTGIVEPHKARIMVAERLANPLLARKGWRVKVETEDGPEFESRPLCRDGEPIEFNRFDALYSPTQDEADERQGALQELTALTGTRTGGM